MSDDIRWDVQAPVRDSKEAGILRRTIALVDASLHPGSNKRNLKLGWGNMTFATAILGFDPTTKVMDAGDGTGSNLIRFPFEPDNWAFRQHSNGFDQVWAVRLSVDKTNKAQDKKNRSTHVIDQQDNQRYGNFADAFWICKTDVDTDFGVNGAGYNQHGAGKRDALAYSTAKNEGFISDGDKFGQLAHVFTFADNDDQATPGGGNPNTPTPGGGGPNTTPSVLTPTPGSGAFNNPPGTDTQVQAAPGTNPTGHEGQTTNGAFVQPGQNPVGPPTVVSTFQGPDGVWHQSFSDGTVK